MGSDVRNAFLPFGGGTHMCPGCFFVMNEAKLMVLALLDRFEFTIPADQLVPPVNKRRRLGMGPEAAAAGGVLVSTGVCLYVVSMRLLAHQTESDVGCYTHPGWTDRAICIIQNDIQHLPCAVCGGSLCFFLVVVFVGRVRAQWRARSNVCEIQLYCNRS